MERRTHDETRQPNTFPSAYTPLLLYTIRVYIGETMRMIEERVSKEPGNTKRISSHVIMISRFMVIRLEFIWDHTNHKQITK